MAHETRPSAARPRTAANASARTRHDATPPLALHQQSKIDRLASSRPSPRPSDQQLEDNRHQHRQRHRNHQVIPRLQIRVIRQKRTRSQRSTAAARHSSGHARKRFLPRATTIAPRDRQQRQHIQCRAHPCAIQHRVVQYWPERSLSSLRRIRIRAEQIAIVDQVVRPHEQAVVAHPTPPHPPHRLPRPRAETARTRYPLAAHSIQNSAGNRNTAVVFVSTIIGSSRPKQPPGPAAKIPPIAETCLRESPTTARRPPQTQRAAPPASAESAAAPESPSA